MSNIKKVFSLGLVVLALAVVVGVSAPKAEAATCTSQSSGDWHTVARWGGCGGGLPQSTDDVVIASGHVLTMSGSATVTSLTINNAGAATGLTIGSGNTLTVSGAVTVSLPSADGTSTLAVGAGTLTVGGNITLVGGAASRIAALTVSTGTVNVTGDLDMSATVRGQVTSTGASNINITGNFPAGGTLDDTGGTITFNKSGAQTVGAYTYAGNLVLSGSGAKTMTGVTTVTGTFSMSGSATATPVITTVGNGVSITGTAVMTTGANNVVTGTLTVGTGATLHLGGFALTISSTSSITGTVDTVTASTGTKLFSGAVTINSGGVFDVSGQNPVVSLGAGFTNNSTTAANFGTATDLLVGNLAGTGSLTFGGHLTISSGTTTLSNTGTTSVAGTLTRTGNLTMGSGSTLVLSGATPWGGAGTLDAFTNANTINYTRAGAQTVYDPAVSVDYYHLGLSGSGAKALSASTAIAGTLTITDSGVDTTATLVGNSNTANIIILTGATKAAGTWGSTGSSATHTTDTYFGGTGKITTVVGGDAGNRGGGETITYTNTADGVSSSSTSNTSTTTEETTPVTVTLVICPAGQMFDASTGKKCNATVVGVSCSAGVMYEAATGKKCTTWTTSGSSSSSASYNFGSVTLHNGSSGAGVMELQKFLNATLKLGLVVDGKLGPKTIGVIKTWQAAHMLVADGFVGPKTMVAMNASVQ